MFNEDTGRNSVGKKTISFVLNTEIMLHKNF